MMELDSPDHSDHENSSPTIDDLKRWTVKKLKGWLEDHGMKRSGSKDVLVKRVFRAYQIY